MRCSNSGERKELFTATLCGLGSTGLILNIEMEVEERFNLRDAQEMMDFDDVVDNLDAIVRSSQHTRLWWFQPSNKVRVSRLDRTSEVSLSPPLPSLPSLTRLGAQPRNPSGSWFWDVLCAYHLIQFLLFIGRFFPRYINPWTSNFAAWLVSKPSVNVDESHRVFNVNCRVSFSPSYPLTLSLRLPSFPSPPLLTNQHLSTPNTQPNGPSPTPSPHPASVPSVPSSTKSLQRATGYDRISHLRSGSRRRMIFG